MLSALGAATAVSPLAAGAAALAEPQAQKTLPAKEGTDQDNLFTRIGVRPLINGRGTFTIISGSRSLPQVKQAMFEASYYFVQLDEMMDGIGAQLGKLTGAEWGIATTGCEAAICLATVACIAGTNVEQCQALPYIKERDQVIIPKHSRNPYDFGVRMTGAEIVEVDSEEALRSKISKRTAMIYILSSPAAEKGPLSISNICSIAKEKGIPVFVDAAAEEPLNPNIHIAAGATLVGYSGGKCMRGPQSSGMLIGQKDLCKAAYYPGLASSLLWPGLQVQQGRGHGSARRCPAVVQARSCRRAARVALLAQEHRGPYEASAFYHVRIPGTGRSV